MGKIAMGRSIGDAYDLTFGRYFAVFGVIWLPVVLIIAANCWLIYPLFLSVTDFMREAARHPNSAGIPPQFARPNENIWLLNLAMVFFSAWIRVGVTKLALGVPRGPSYVYVFLGMDELRVALGYCAFIAMYVVAFVGAFFGGAVIAGVAGALYSGGAFEGIDPAALAIIGVALGAIAILAVLFAWIYVFARFFFLFVPATVAERRFALLRSWELSEGNFWRIVVVGIATLSPLAILSFFLLLFVYVPLAISFFAIVQHHKDVLNNPALMNALLLTDLAKNLGIYVPVATVIGLVVVPITCGLSYSPAAFAYRSLRQNAELMAGSS